MDDPRDDGDAAGDDANEEADTGDADDSASDAETAEFDTISSLLRRPGENRLKQWLLLSGDRLLVAAVLLVSVFLTFLALAVLRPFDMEQLLTETSTLQQLFTAMLRGAILLVSIVVSISSVVLTQEITDIDTEQERIDASLAFRRRTEDLIDEAVSPGRPAEFMWVILNTVYRESRTLRDRATENGDEAFRREIAAFADSVAGAAQDTGKDLHGAQFGTFQVLSAGLNYDYSHQLNTARRFRRTYDDELDDGEIAALDDLIDTLKFFATGREYFQSLYYKREIARLSSVLLYVTLPVIVFISYFLLAIGSQTVPDVEFYRFSSLSVFVMFAYTVSISPYVVLTSFVIRLATITLRTLAAGPFVLQQRTGRKQVEWELLEGADDWDE